MKNQQFDPTKIDGCDGWWTSEDGMKYPPEKQGQPLEIWEFDESAQEFVVVGTKDFTADEFIEINDWLRSIGSF